MIIHVASYGVRFVIKFQTAQMALMNPLALVQQPLELVLIQKAFVVITVSVERKRGVVRNDN